MQIFRVKKGLIHDIAHFRVKNVDILPENKYFWND